MTDVLTFDRNTEKWKLLSIGPGRELSQQETEYIEAVYRLRFQRNLLYLLVPLCIIIGIAFCLTVCTAVDNEKTCQTVTMSIFGSFSGIAFLLMIERSCKVIERPDPPIRI